MSGRPTLSVFFSHLDHVLRGDNSKLIGLARAAEAAGADQIVFSEHVALASVIRGEEGEAAIFPFPPEENYPEPMVSLAAIAGATDRIRLSTGILIAPLRNAPLLAKQIATLDHLSGGRLDMGLGSGWHEPELRAAGVDPADRLAVLEEVILACRALWSPGPASFEGRHVRFGHLNCVPKPLAGANLPLWLAGPPTLKGIDRVVRLGQGWLPLGNVPPDKLALGRDLLREAEARYGIAEGAIGIRAFLDEVEGGSVEDRLDRTFANAAALVAAGATHLQLPLWRLIGDLDDAEAVITGARERADAL